MNKRFTGISCLAKLLFYGIFLICSYYAEISYTINHIINVPTAYNSINIVNNETSNIITIHLLLLLYMRCNFTYK